MSIINPISTINQAIPITSGTGAIDIGTDAAAKTVTIGNTTGASSVVLNRGASGSISVPAFNADGVIINNASGVLSTLSPSTAGLVLTSNGPSAAPSFQSVPGALTWTTITGGAQTVAMNANQGYIANTTGLLTLQLPTVAAVGATIYVIGLGAGTWRINQTRAGEQIFIGSVFSTSGTAGAAVSNNRYDCITLVYMLDDTVTPSYLWTATSVISAGINLI